jgi:hypothetical protein
MTVRIIGTISAYHYNVSGTRVLPGLSFAQDVTYFHDAISNLRTLDEARQKQREQEKETPPKPPPSIPSRPDPGLSTPSDGLGQS